jgi:hypothetical protein
METFQLVSQMLLERVTRDLKRQSGTSRPVSAPVPAAVSAAGIAMPAPAAAPLPVSGPPMPSPAPQPVAASASAAPAARPGRMAAAVPEAPVRRAGREAQAPRPDWNGAQEVPAYGREINLPGESSRARGVPTGAEHGEAAAEAVVVPIKLGRGERLREITLRIVVEKDEAA